MRITVMPQNMEIDAPAGASLLATLRSAGLAPEAPCGGDGRCGKCMVFVDGAPVLACQTEAREGMTVTLPDAAPQQILSQGLTPELSDSSEGWHLAFDIGTTTVVGYLLDGAQEVCTRSMPNPQRAFGADVISRIRHALDGQMDAMTEIIREGLTRITASVCADADISPDLIRTVSIVGNPAMQQLFLGILPRNLAQVPFSPVLKDLKPVQASQYLPICTNAELLIVPDISGFVGADTLACVLATRMDEAQELTLLVDIGTNGEMVLTDGNRLIACSTAAGPALEGANISRGMNARDGAIDHVKWEDDTYHCSVIGNGKPVGICGSGIIDAVAAALDAGHLNTRGRVLTEDRCIHLTEDVLLTQEDIREVQLVKGAIAAGIELMAAQLGYNPADIRKVYLAGAFGSFMDPHAACRIGLLSAVSEEQITAVGNAAGAGAKLLAISENARNNAEELVQCIEFLELASLPDFPRCFAKNMRF